MSVDLVALCPGAAPEKAGWQAALDLQHFPVSLDSKFDPAKDTGFWPAQLRGEPAGFEFYPLAPSEWKNLPNLPQPGRFVSGFQFTTGARITEFESSLFVAVALAKACHGTVYVPDENTAYSTDEELDALVKSLDQQRAAPIPQIDRGKKRPARHPSTVIIRLIPPRPSTTTKSPPPGETPRKP